MVLTLGCGKYRVYDQGTLANGLPRLLDMGQVRAAHQRCCTWVPGSLL
jgi:hydroxylamine reductase (hybrid-cluster protein)